MELLRLRPNPAIRRKAGKGIAVHTVSSFPKPAAGFPDQKRCRKAYGEHPDTQPKSIFICGESRPSKKQRPS